LPGITVRERRVAFAWLLDVEVSNGSYLHWHGYLQLQGSLVASILNASGEAASICRCDEGAPRLLELRLHHTRAM